MQNTNNNTTMEGVTEVKGFKTSDGQFFEDEALAMAVQGDLDLKAKLTEFVEIHVDKVEDRREIFDLLYSKRGTLSQILKG